MSVSAQRDLRTAIETRKFEPVYYIHGDDEYRKEQAVSQLVSAAVDAGTRDFNFDAFRGDDVEAEQLGVALISLPMLALHRVVVVRDVGALRKTARTELDRYLTSPARETVLVMTSPAGEKPDAALAHVSMSVAFPPLSEDKFAPWLVRHARESGIEISEESAALLGQAVGTDSVRAVGELDKLASFANGRAITADDVEAVVGVRRGETSADLLDAVAERNGARAYALVGQVLLHPKVTGVQLVMQLTTQFLAMAWGRANRDAGMSASRMESELIALLKSGGAVPGRSWGDATKCWARNLPKWSAADLSNALARLRAADVALKDTRISSDEAIIGSLVLSIAARPSRREVA